MGKIKTGDMVLGIARILVGFSILWTFLDKLVGFGFPTEYGKAWINGASPTYGYLTQGTFGILKSFFVWLASFSSLIDWIYMAGLLGIGISMIFGIANKMGSFSGFTLFILIWLSAFPPLHNPFVDEHLVYAVLFLCFYYLESGEKLGFGGKWAKSKAVKKFGFLK